MSDYREGMPTSQLDVVSIVKNSDTLVGNQDGKTRNFTVADVRGINDDRKSKNTTYSSEQIEKLIATLTSLSDGDITVIVNAISELNNTVNSNKEEVNKELENRYKKDETFSQDEVKNLISNLTKLMANKVDKEEGKGLSTNDYTNAEKQKIEDLRNGNFDLINGSLRVAQRYYLTGIHENPNNQYIMDRFLCNGTGTVVPVQGGGCAVTGTINFKYWIEKLDFNLLPEKFNITYSVNNIETVLEVIKADCTVDADGNGLIFDKDITDATLNYVHYGKGPFRNRKYGEELQACKRYYQQILALGIVINYNINLPVTFPVSMRIAPTVTIYDGYNRIVSEAYKNKINILGTGSVDVSPKSNTATKDLISCITCNNTISSSGYALVLLVLDSDIYN